MSSGMEIEGRLNKVDLLSDEHLIFALMRHLRIITIQRLETLFHPKSRPPNNAKSIERIPIMTDTHSRNEDPSRYRTARSDAPVGTITAKIEAVFNLPEGSVVLVKPDGRKKRSDATIRSLREEWGVE